MKLYLFSDLDRTIIPNGHAEESTMARPLLRKLASLPEVLMIYVSGRDEKLLKQAVRDYELPMPDFAVGDVGTAIYHPKNDDWQQDSEWAEQISHKWSGIPRQKVIEMLCSTPGVHLQEPEKQSEFKISFYTPVDYDHDALTRPVEEMLKKRNIAASIIWSIDEISECGLLDILPQKATKEGAIRFLADHLGAEPEKIVFSGDSGNDLPVLISDLQSVLVNNAASALKRRVGELAKEKGTDRRLYLARGNFLGMNGNYSAGVLEGVAHYLPDLGRWMADQIE